MQSAYNRPPAGHTISGQRKPGRKIASYLGLNIYEARDGKGYVTDRAHTCGRYNYHRNARSMWCALLTYDRRA